MAKTIGPIRPRKKDEKSYERAIKTKIVNPLFQALQGQLDQAETAFQAMAAANSFSPALNPQLVIGVATDQIFLLNAYHYNRAVKMLTRAIGIDVRPYLLDAPIGAFMHQKILENVDLIKTIPPRMLDQLKQDLQAALQTAPFDKQVIYRLLRDTYKSTGYNLRRLARDQSSKTISQLTQIRQQQVGIREYVWQTAEDQRVRPTHQANNGQTFAWDSPPPTGAPGMDIMCRCVAIGIIPEARPAPQIPSVTEPVSRN